MVDMGCDEPHLGLATTENLFEELIIRFRISHPAEDIALALQTCLMIYKDNPEVMNYRTVDH